MIFIAFGSTLLIGDTGHDVIQKCRATTDARNESWAEDYNKCLYLDIVIRRFDSIYR